MGLITIEQIAKIIEDDHNENWRKVEDGVHDYLPVATSIYNSFRPFEKDCEHQCRLHDMLYCPDCGHPCERNIKREIFENQNINPK